MPSCKGVVALNEVVLVGYFWISVESDLRSLKKCMRSFLDLIL